MPDKVYADFESDQDVEQPFLEPTGVKRRLVRKSLSWKTVSLIQWLVICGFCYVSTTLYSRVHIINAENAERVFCKPHSSVSCLILVRTDALVAPAQHLIHNENVVFTSGFGRSKTKYMGPPTPDNEEAWSDLYNCKRLHFHSFSNRS